MNMPNHSIEAEQAVLGSLLISETAWARISRKLGAADFYRADHRIIYTAIAALHRDGSAVDAVSVFEYLERTGAIGDTGGLAYIGRLANDTISADNVETYAARVRERSVLRKLTAVGNGLVKASTAPSQETTAQLVAVAQRQLNALQVESSTRAEWEPMAELVCAASIEPEPINWLWNGWLAAGKLHILAGTPGTGKTTVAIAFASAISCGGRWPDHTKATTGDVLIWSSEDDPKDILVPRLIAMGANLSRIHFVSTATDGETRRAFDPATDIAQLRTTIKQLGIRPSLLVVDPIVSAVAGDSHKGSETRRSLQPLVDLGTAESCAILGISHFSKGTAGRAVVERVTGSIAFGALARVVLAAAKLPDDRGGGRFIARAKSNIGVDGGGYGYELQQCSLPNHPGISASALRWGDAIEGNALDILAQAEVTEDSETRTQTSEAKNWLFDLLSDGAIKTTDAMNKAKVAGISEKSLRTARQRLKVVPKKR